MSTAEKINRWTTRFASKKTEADFQRFIFDGNFKNNAIAITVPVALNGLYAFVDPYILENPSWAIAIRLSSVVLCIAIYAAMMLTKLSRHHETLSALIVLITGGAISLIIWREPTLDNNYYVGLIQGGLFLGFLLRISFVKSLFVMCAGLALFALAVSQKQQTEEALLQFFVVATMFAMASFGIYFIQRFRRHDFLKTKLIEAQNVKLNAMLTDARLDNERKLAAMNMLVHLVKTPVHQIAGFTDVVLNALTNKDPGGPQEDCIESAVYIKNASDDLAENVSKLLTYHRLDDTERNGQTDAVHLNTMLQDMRDQIDPEIFSALKAPPCDISNYSEPIQTALGCIVSNFNKHADQINHVEIVLEKTADGVAISFLDDGPTIPPETFADAVKPLTKIDNYLSFDSSNMPMGLRTVARVAELGGGSLTYERTGERNVLKMTLTDFSAGEKDKPGNHLRLVS